AAPTPAPAPAPTPVATEPVPPPAPVPPAPPPPPAGTDYAAQVKTLFHVGACGGDPVDDPRFDKRLVKSHCEEMQDNFRSYKKAWADQAKAFIAALRPANLPTTVVYPFGGGDLSSALVVYPDATEITTISLEAAGDVRTIDSVKKNKMRAELDEIAHNVQRLYKSAHSTTKSLQAVSHATLPGTIVFALSALAVHDMEPLSLRYFDIEPDGSLSYLDDAELDRRAVALADKAKEHKTDPHFWYEQTSAFANVEITFRPRSQPDAAPRVYRHIVANLDDTHMNADRRVITHLETKGKVAVMTKAASFLLWYDDFTNIRNYLLGHIAWMISDASGIPPSYAGPAGFEQITYGEFTGPYFNKDEKHTQREFIKLWKDQEHRKLPFRFGYPDIAKHNHLMITRPKA
ncbi:MAG: hypothetical protein K8W52_25195, partial [Deltaproteobacteria bacterium]|nr:hypothetical protein [Deltaproteobacteria bacterium]